jgi:hypothetical protein
MIADWVQAVLPAFITALLATVPGLIVVIAGWGVRRLTLLLLAPAVSIALIAVSATVAPVLGIPWTVLPLLAITVLAAGCAYLLRRQAHDRPVPTSRASAIAVPVALLAAAGILLAQFAWAFGSPESIAQRFDNIVHLNGVRFALETANASPFSIGATSDIGFYPNAWHALVSLTSQLSGADIAVSVNAANLVIVALVWTASNMSLAGALFAGRATAYATAAALSTGFGAFPALFFNWGVLYPNVLGYSLIPAALTAGLLLFDTHGWASRTRGGLLLLVVATGMFLAHPNALLAATLFGWLLGLGMCVRDLIEHRSRALWIRTAVIGIGGALACVALWTIARTPAGHSGWSPWQNTAQAFGEAILASPRGYMPTIVTTVLLVIGLIAIVTRPRLLPILLPFLAAVTLFLLASGFPVQSTIRSLLTNPWYSDSNRLAALLPIAAIPVATAGAVFIVDLFRRWIAQLEAGGAGIPPRWIRACLVTVGVVSLVSVAVGPNVTGALRQVREAYSATADSLLLSADERALLDRLDDQTPADALIIGSPRNGASLAYALADRDVTERHIFGSPSDDERFLDLNLRNIDTDPEVCAAVNRVGVDYVLDFGSHDVIDDAAAGGYAGVIDLAPTPRLVLVDSEGPDARLFRIEGC